LFTLSLLKRVFNGEIESKSLTLEVGTSEQIQHQFNGGCPLKYLPTLPDSRQIVPAQAAIDHVPAPHSSAHEYFPAAYQWAAHNRDPGCILTQVLPPLGQTLQSIGPHFIGSAEVH
jgi:hypothetical protein